MDILSYIEFIICFIFNLGASIVYRTKIKEFIWVFIWRIVTALSLLDFIFSLIFKRINFEQFTLKALFLYILLTTCLLFMPLRSQTCICANCGKRVYWKLLISNHCQHCGGTIAK